MLIPPDAPAAMMEAILKYYRNPDLMANHGKAARQQIETSFSMDAMTQGYLRVYDKALRAIAGRRKRKQSMCGIVGLFDTRGKREIDRQLLGRMNQTAGSPRTG